VTNADDNTPPPKGPQIKHSQDYINGWTQAIKDVLDKKIDPMDWWVNSKANSNANSKQNSVVSEAQNNAEYDQGYSDAMNKIIEGLKSGITMSPNKDGGQSGDLPQIPWELPPIDNKSNDNKSGDSDDSDSDDSDSDAQDSASDAQNSASDASDAFNEANTCLEIISGKQYEYPIFYDIEEKNILSKGKSEVSQIAKNFCTTLKNNNYLCGIYASANPLNNLFDDECKNNFPIWVAHYDVDKPKYNGNWGIWQYTSQGNVNGINGKVDLNHGVINYEDIIKNQHLNGY
jgi:hypothetical protein